MTWVWWIKRLSPKVKNSAIMVLTSRGTNWILGEGGSQAWRVDRTRARSQEYVVCAQNANKGTERGATEPHGTAFLVGHIADVVPATEYHENAQSWLLRFDAYALISRPKAWNKQRNPVHYGSLDEFGIDPASLTFQPMPDVDAGALPEMSEAPAARRNRGKAARPPSIRPT